MAQVDKKIADSAVWDNYTCDDNLIQASSAEHILNHQSQMMFCYKCNQIIPSNSVFCPWCQTELLVTCPKCGKKYSSQYPVCNQCGVNREQYLAELKQREEERIRKETLESEEQKKRERKEEMRRKEKEERKRILEEQIEIELRPYKRKAKRLILVGCSSVLLITCIVLYIEIMIEWLAWTVGILLALTFFTFLFWGIFKIDARKETIEKGIIVKENDEAWAKLRKQAEENYEAWAKLNPEGVQIRERWRKQAEETEQKRQRSRNINS